MAPVPLGRHCRRCRTEGGDLLAVAGTRRHVDGSLCDRLAWILIKVLARPPMRSVLCVRAGVALRRSSSSATGSCRAPRAPRLWYLVDPPERERVRVVVGWDERPERPAHHLDAEAGDAVGIGRRAEVHAREEAAEGSDELEPLMVVLLRGPDEVHRDQFAVGDLGRRLLLT